LYKDESRKTANISFVLKGTDDYESNEIYSTVEDFILNNFNGRLLTALRNHDGKVYTPYFNSENLPGLSLKMFTARTTPKHVDSVLKTMTGILEDLATNGITDAEFEGFKEMWANRRERSVSVKHNSAWNLFEKIMYDLPAFVGQYNKKLSDVTKEDINAYLKETYAHAKCCLIITGNFNEQKLTSLNDVLKFRPLDRYMDEHYIDKELNQEFYDYLEYLEKHPDDTKGLKFIVSGNINETKKEEGQEKTTKKFCLTGSKYPLTLLNNSNGNTTDKGEEEVK
ncbi:MAG: insulinase family protein, partial [Clostridia bacterium]|nr:insulinase family protein [Clostridia bacterium]